MPTSPAEAQLVRLTRRPPAGVRGAVLRASKPSEAPPLALPEAPTWQPSAAPVEPAWEALPSPSLAAADSLAPSPAFAPTPVAEAPAVAAPVAPAAAPAWAPRTEAPLAPASVPVAPASAPVAPVSGAGQAGALVEVGLDLGRSEVRVFDGTRLLNFPALLGGPVATIRRGGAALVEDHLEKNLELRWEGMTYSMGEYALEQPFLLPLNEENLLDSELNRVLMLGALALLCKKAGLVRPRFKVCLGLPVYLSRRQDALAMQLRAWEGQYSFDFRGEPIEFEVAQLDPLPQPLGAIYAAYVSGQLEPNPEELVGVIDPGHLTTDWVVYRLPNELKEVSGHTTAVAGYRLEEAVKGYLAEQMLPRINTAAVQEALFTGVYRDNQGDPIEIPDALIEEKKAIMAQHIYLTVKQSWRDLRISKMLLVGGFGRLLYPMLTQFPYFRDLQLAQDPRHANVRGFYEHAIAQPLRG